MKKTIIIVAASIVLAIVAVISIVKINNTSKMNSLDVNNNQEDIKTFNEPNELEQEQNFEIENNQINEQLEKKDTQGEVTVTVKFLNPILQDEDYLNFEVYLNTHSIELDKYNLGEMTTLFIGSDTKITEGIIWETVGGGHHISGTLKVPKQYNGEKINYVDADFIELEVRDLSGIDSRKFKWKKEEL